MKAPARQPARAPQAHALMPAALQEPMEMEGVGEALALGEALAEGEELVEGVALRERVWLGVLEPEAPTDLLAVGLAEREVVALRLRGVSLGVPLGEGVSVDVPVREREGEAPRESEAVGVREAEAEGVLLGKGAARRQESV